MGPLFRFAPLFLLTGIAYAQTTAKAAEPDQLVRQGAPGPFFLSARRATAQDGSILWSAFDEDTRFLLRHTIDSERSRDANASSVGVASSTPCAIAMVNSSMGSARRLSEEALTAGAIYRGTVSTLTPGFEFYVPVSVVGIEITKTIRVEAGFPGKGRILVMHPYADFTIGGTRFCNAASANSAPHIGDEVLLFADVAPIDTSRTFLSIAIQQLFLQRSGQLIVSEYLHDPSIRATTLDELEQQILLLPGPDPSRRSQLRP
jgi:hypothetical protein